MIYKAVGILLSKGIVFFIGGKILSVFVEKKKKTVNIKKIGDIEKDIIQDSGG